MGKWILTGVLVVAVLGIGIYAAAQETPAAEEKPAVTEKAAEKAEGSAEKPADKPAAKKAPAAPAAAPAERPARGGRSVWRELMAMSAKKGTPVVILANGEDLGLSEEQVKKIEAVADKAAKDAQALLTDEQKTKLAAIQEEMARPRERRGR